MCAPFLLLAICFMGVDDEKGKLSAPFECGHTGRLCFDRTGSRLVGISQRGELLYWPSRDFQKPVVIPLERKPDGGIFDRAPSSVVLNADGPNAVLFYYDGRVQVWDVEGGRKVKDLPNDRTHLSYSRRSADGKQVACLSHGNEDEGSVILFWNTRDWSPAGQIECNDRINDFCFAPNGRELMFAVGYPTDRKNRGFTGLVAWDIETKQELESIEYGTGFPIRVAMSSDGRWVATGGGDAVPVGPNSRSLSGHLRVFDWKAKKLVAEPYTLPSDYVRAVAFSPDGKVLYSVGEGSGGNPNSVRRHSITNNWKEERPAGLGPKYADQIAVSPDGRTVLVPDIEGLKVLDAQTLAVLKMMLKFRQYPEDQEELDRLRGKKKKGVSGRAAGGREGALSPPVNHSVSRPLLRPRFGPNPVNS